MDPVTGRFRVRASDDGITQVAEVLNTFYSRWSPEVFSPFNDWVVTNHPEDAEVMWGVSSPSDGDVEEALELFATNTRRFVDAQPAG